MEFCNECGMSVAWGTYRFANRVPDVNSLEERQKMGKPYPEGDYICAECAESSLGLVQAKEYIC